MTARKRKPKNTPKKAATVESPRTTEGPGKNTADEPLAVEAEKAARERDEFKDRLQRTTAEFSNYQKRMQREIEEIRKYAVAPLALDLLGTLDNFHRALQAAAGKVDDGFLKGFQIIEDHLKEILQKQGITPIDAHLQPFDPNFHEALLEAVEESIPDRTVLEELEKGYMLHDRLLRPTRVKVSRKQAVNKEEAAPEAAAAVDDGKDRGENDDKDDKD